ncbi:MAG: hypothetical protein ACPKM0_07770 [Pleomorphochaeta sp.]|nr:hypothetical protein [Sphaerochaetaceae bacterium]
MLESRRVLEVGNRLYWYMIWLSFGIFIYYFLSLFYDVNSEYLIFVSRVLSTFLLFSLVFGIWTLVYSLAIYFRDKIFPTRIFILSFLRILIILVLDIIYSVVNNIAGESLFI